MKREENGIDLSLNTNVAGNDNCTPTENRTIDVNKEALDAYVSRPDNSGYDYSAHKELGEKLFTGIDDALKLHP